MKNILALTALIISCLTSYSQVDDKNWILYHSSDGVEIYTQEIDCRSDDVPAQKAIIVKVVNTTENGVKVEWDLNVWYNNEKLTQNVKSGENHYTIDLNGNQSTQGSCDVPNGALYIFKDFITYVSPTKLTRFELENVSITKT